MLKPIDYFLDRITMYRLVLYYLIALVTIAAGLSWFGTLQYNPLAILGSAAYLVVICWITNKIFSYVFEVPANVESFFITALILALIVTPLGSLHNIVFLTAVAGLAISSKFILAINKRHIFNPAAIAVVLTSFGPRQSASWWVGTTAMLPYVLIGGLLIIRKIRRGLMVASFFAAVIVSSVIVNISLHGDIMGSLQKTVLHSSLFFLAFVMLTEPLTSPHTRNRQMSYGALAGLLFPPQLHVAGIYSTPEIALSISNLYAYVISPKIKLVTRLVRKERTGPDSADFVFSLSKPFGFKPGQYMEWTLPHYNADSRGNRRYFTIASSPTENNLRLGVKFYRDGSSYKEAMLGMDQAKPVVASQLSGDFVLPDDPSSKLAFIAGGIGITPYRSMVKYLLDTDDKRNIVLLYSEKGPENFVYQDVFSEAEERLGMKPVYTITEPSQVPAGWKGRTGMVSAEMIRSEVPDFLERTFYLSGPHGMVRSMQAALHSIGVPRHHIRIDFFPGYA